MAGDILGGIGLGLQKGIGFAQQKDMQDRQMAMQEQQAQRANEEHDWKRQAQEQAAKDRERQNKLADVWRKNGDKDLSDPAVFGEFAKEAVPLMSPQEIAAVQSQSKALRSLAGQQAVQKFMYNDGDLSGFQTALDAKMPGAKLGKVGDKITITRPDGETRDFASVKGMITMLGIDGALDAMQASEASGRESAKEMADIELKRSQAGLNRDRGRALLMGGGARGAASSGGSKSGDGGTFNPFKSQKEYGDSWPDEAQFDRAAGYRHYAQLSDANPNIAASRSGAASLMEASRALAEGGGEYRPMLNKDGSIELRVKVGQNDYVVERNVPEDRMLALLREKEAGKEGPGFFSRLLGAQDTPVIDEGLIGDVYLYGLRKSAFETPEQFQLGWRIANDPEEEEKVADAARGGDAQARKALNLAQIIMRGNERARQTAPKDRPSKPGGDKAVSAEQQALAKDLGLSGGEDGKSLGEQVADDAKRVGAGLAEGAKSVAQTALGLNEYQRAFRISSTLDLWRAAKTPVAKKLYAKQLLQLAGDNPDLISEVRRGIGDDGR